jgi:hypothetical protein
VPTTEVEFGHCDEALYRVFDLCQREERLGVSHEAVQRVSVHRTTDRPEGDSSLCDALQHRPRLEDEGGQSDAAQVGSGAQL